MSRGHTVRFFIEDGLGRRSTTWRVWTPGRTSDIYFAHRAVAGELKGSLHESGSWQYGMTKERLKTAHEVRGWDGDSRHFMKWQQPPEMTPGVTLAVEFAFPTRELQLLPGSDHEGCLAISAAPCDQAVVVALFLSKPGADLRGRWPAEQDMGSQYLADFPLPNQERVYLVHTNLRPPPVALTDLEDRRRQFSFMTDTKVRRARFCSVVVNEDGSRLFVEGAVHPDGSAVPM